MIPHGSEHVQPGRFQCGLQESQATTQNGTRETIQPDPEMKGELEECHSYIAVYCWLLY